VAAALAGVALGALAIGLVVSQREAPQALALPAREHVDDAERLLGPFGVVVEEQCARLARDLGVDVRVVARRGGGEDVAPLAERLFRELGVGDAAPTGGLLVLLDPEGGRARIEVSYSLEGVLTDLLVSRLVRDQLVPYASHRAAGMAVMDVLHFLRNVLLEAVAAGELALAPELREGDALERLLAGRSGGAGAQVALPELPSHTEYKARVPDARRARYAPSADPLESALALQRTRRELVGDPTLELFTEGSRVMRERYPVAPYEELLRADAFDRAAPLAVQTRGDLAFVGTGRRVRDFVPVLLVREAGLWRVDLVATFQHFRFDDEGMYVLDNAATPYAAFVPGATTYRDASVEPLDLGDEPLAAAIARLERSSAPADRFRLAEILLRNCFVSAEAISLYAEAAEATPPEPRFVTTFAERAASLGMAAAAIPAVARLGPAHASRLAWLYERSGEPELARAAYRRALDWNPRDAYARRALARLE
jgi:tetratricopeptide (TPR) repeat protein